MKDTVIWNIEEGMKLNAADVGMAEVKRAALFERVRKFMDTYEFMVFPVSQHPPFDVTQPYLTEVNGVPMETYIDWMRSCYYITATGHPAISVPCGFTEFRRLARRRPDSRPPPKRVQRPATRLRLPAGNRLLEAKARDSRRSGRQTEYAVRTTLQYSADTIYAHIQRIRWF